MPLPIIDGGTEIRGAISRRLQIAPASACPALAVTPSRRTAAAIEAPAARAFNTAVIGSTFAVEASTSTPTTMKAAAAAMPAAMLSKR
jgi:hypothetical protein